MSLNKTLSLVSGRVSEIEEGGAQVYFVLVDERGGRDASRVKRRKGEESAPSSRFKGTSPVLGCPPSLPARRISSITMMLHERQGS